MSRSTPQRFCTPLLPAIRAIVMSAGTNAQQTPVDPPDTKRVAELWEQMRSANFVKRERAALSLHEMGAAVIDELQTRLTRENDAEIRRRVEDVLFRLKRRDEKVRQSRFLAGDDILLPGWRWFSRSVGDRPALRRLFVQMRQDQPDSVAKLDGSSRDRAEVVMETTTRVRLSSMGGSQTVSAFDFMLLLLPLGDPQVPSDAAVDAALRTLMASEAHRPLLDQTATRDIVTKLVSRWIRRSQPTAAPLALSIGLRLNLEAAVEVARQVLASAERMDEMPADVPPALKVQSSRQAMQQLLALQAIAQFGQRSDIAFALSLLGDQRVVGTSTYDRGQVRTPTLGDAAAAATVRLLGVLPEDHGFDPRVLETDLGFVLGLIGQDAAKPERRRERDRKLRALAERNDNPPAVPVNQPPK